MFLNVATFSFKIAAIFEVFYDYFDWTNVVTTMNPRTEKAILLIHYKSIQDWRIIFFGNMSTIHLPSHMLDFNWTSYFLALKQLV